ncbi:MAG: hypothetical protein ABSA33_06795 [Candidatus Micrarchaeaceae archaeon]
MIMVVNLQDTKFLKTVSDDLPLPCTEWDGDDALVIKRIPKGLSPSRGNGIVPILILLDEIFGDGQE